MNKYVPKTKVKRIVASTDKILDMIPSLWKSHGMSKEEISFWSDIDHVLSDVRRKIRLMYKV